ncbi:MAG TPA: metalloregulator ArsR/SmtB family transcription factor [Vicinamibacterales bacterium]|nr:metalloregulator ArsR/SmtB family transcription factor [Vicinamibacterales bacterium]
MSKKRAEKALAGAALIFAALGDPTRLALLQRLSDDGPASISTLAETFAMTRQGVTKHLQVLAGAGVIEGSRHGREHVWALNPGRLAECQRRLDRIARGWDDALSRLKQHLERG